MPDFPLTATTEAAPGKGVAGPARGSIVSLPNNVDFVSVSSGMPILNPGPHDPECHEHKEPETAGDGWWLKEVARLVGHSIAAGELVNGNEAASILGVSRQRVRDIADRGTIRRQVIGRHSFYPVADLRAWLKLKSEGKIRPGRNNGPVPVFVDVQETVA